MDSLYGDHVYSGHIYPISGAVPRKIRKTTPAIQSPTGKTPPSMNSSPEETPSSMNSSPVMPSQKLSHKKNIDDSAATVSIIPSQETSIKKNDKDVTVAVIPSQETSHIKNNEDMTIAVSVIPSEETSHNKTDEDVTTAEQRISRSALLSLCCSRVTWRLALVARQRLPHSPSYDEATLLLSVLSFSSCLFHLMFHFAIDASLGF
ncbi:hypothetical protein HNY73_001893 [Argiope bruennichi]|nr:hypothetical protein HNY73_001893 [Argiope bruennichi]